MNDIELTRAFERGGIRNEDFHHASHVKVAWVYLSESRSIEEAAEKVSATIRRFAASAGKPEKYHETITQFWMRLLATLRDLMPGKNLTEILEVNPRLLEKDFPLEYYSRDVLYSDQARMSWIEPDLRPLTDATSFRSSCPTCDPSYRVVRG